MVEGQVLAGRYKLVDRIGEGGMGEVWRATDLTLRRDVAIKRAKSGDTNQLRREARIGAGLQHPNVVTVYDEIVDGRDRLLVLEYFPARSLADILNTDGVLEARRVAEIGAQLASALAEMHGKRMVHRDITPANVLIGKDGTAKLTDLGIAMWRELTRPGGDGDCGDPDLIAPEVNNGNVATAESDVFMLGGTLFAAVEGVSHQHGRRPRPGGRLAAVLSALLDPDPARRPTAGRAREMLLEAATESRRRAAVPVFAAIASVAVLGIALWLLLLPEEQRSIAAVMGDPRTADPCAVLDPSVLGRFGVTEFDTDRGGLQQCDVFVHLSQNEDDKVDVRVELANPETGAPVVPSSARGPVTVDRPSMAEGECRRTLRLADQSRVIVVATHFDDRPAELCPMADAAADRAAVLLGNGGEVPRRPQPIEPTSPFRLRACTLLETGDVATVLPGVQPPRSDFADWECDWAGASDGSVSVIFDRSRLLAAPDDGYRLTLHGRETWVEADGDGVRTCNVMIVFGPYVDPDGGDDRLVYLVRVVLRGDQPGERLCEPATAVANAVAARLPR